MGGRLLIRSSVLGQYPANERSLNRLRAPRRNRSEQTLFDTLADDRGRVDHPARLRIQAADPRQRSVSHRGRWAAAGRDRLRNQKRISAREA